MDKQEPWRIDKDSVHFKILQGWLSERFINWLIAAGWQYNLSKSELLIRIVETIRRISWETFKILKERTGKEATLPFIIISACPTGELSALKTVLERNSDSDILCNKSAVMKSLGVGYLIVVLETMQQMLGAISGGPIVWGAAYEGGIAIYDQLAIDLFERCDSEARQKFLRTVTEEAFHCFAKQTNEFRNSEITQELSKKPEGLIPQERWLIDFEIEIKYGVKQMVNELLQILKQKEDEFFSMLPLKIKSSPNN